MIRVIKSLPLFGLALVLLWGGGFLSYVNDVQALEEPAVTKGMIETDAIVVLTGGSERLSSGVKLLNAGFGKKLFISGVHRGLSVDRILSGEIIEADKRDCCIALGYEADSTIGNAYETRDWMKKEGFTSLRLVTANYHMPRSLKLFHAALPGIAIVPFPVTPDSVMLREWQKHPGTLQLLVNEYDKYLAASVKVWIESL